MNPKCQLYVLDERGRRTSKSALMTFSIPGTPYIFSGCTIHGRYHICGDSSDPCSLVDTCSETGNIVCQMSGRYLGVQYEPTFKEHTGSISEYRSGNANFHSSIAYHKDDDGEGDIEADLIDLYEESGYSHVGDSAKIVGENFGDGVSSRDDNMDIDEVEPVKSSIEVSEASTNDRYNDEFVRYKKSGTVTGLSQFDFLPIIPHPPLIDRLSSQSSLMIQIRSIQKPVNPMPIYDAFRSSAYIKNRLSIPKCLRILSGKATVQTNIDAKLAGRVNAFLCPAVISCANVIYTDKCASISTSAILHMFANPDICDEAHVSQLIHFHENVSEFGSMPKKKTPGDTKEIDNSILASLSTFINNILRASLELLKGGYRIKNVPIIEEDSHLRDLLLISCIEPSAKKPQRKTRHDPNTTKPEKKDAENTENQLKVCLNHMVSMYGVEFTRTRILEFCDIHDPRYIEKLHFKR